MGIYGIEDSPSVRQYSLVNVKYNTGVGKIGYVEGQVLRRNPTDDTYSVLVEGGRVEERVPTEYMRVLERVSVRSDVAPLDLEVLTAMRLSEVEIRVAYSETELNGDVSPVRATPGLEGMRAVCRAQNMEIGYAKDDGGCWFSSVAQQIDWQQLKHVVPASKFWEKVDPYLVGHSVCQEAIREKMISAVKSALNFRQRHMTVDQKNELHVSDFNDVNVHDVHFSRDLRVVVSFVQHFGVETSMKDWINEHSKVNTSVDEFGMGVTMCVFHFKTERWRLQDGNMTMETVMPYGCLGTHHRYDNRLEPQLTVRVWFHRLTDILRNDGPHSVLENHYSPLHIKGTARHANDLYQLHDVVDFPHVGTRTDVLFHDETGRECWFRGTLVVDNGRGQWLVEFDDGTEETVKWPDPAGEVREASSPACGVARTLTFSCDPFGSKPNNKRVKTLCELEETVLLSECRKKGKWIAPPVLCPGTSV
jgi:hypothetical protein